MSSDMHRHGERGRAPGLGPCPPSEVLVAYGLNDISDAVRDKVNEHLTTCNRCAMKTRALLAAFEAKFGPASDRGPK